VFVGLRANLSVLGGGVGGVGGVDSPEDPPAFPPSCPALPLRFAVITRWSGLPWLALSSLLIRVSPHLAHLALSVGFIRVHSEQCHCNTDAIEPILHA